MKKISKSDQPARLPPEEQARIDAIRNRLSDPRRGHYAEGSGWSRIIVSDNHPHGFFRIHGHIHYDSDGNMKFYSDGAGEDLQ